MLCLQTFQEKYPADFPSWANWVDFVNSNYEYGQNSSTLLDYVGHCRISDLPSFHPHWREESRLQHVKELVVLKQKFEECIANHDKIKIFFNKTTSLEDIEKMVLEKEKKAKGV